jgi:phage-related protein
MGWQVRFHRTDNEKCPTFDFIGSLSGEDQKRIRERLEMVEQHGPKYDEFSGQLTEVIWELRFRIATGIVRLFYFYQPGYMIVITHGVCKKYQKIKQTDIRLATRYMNEYLASRG